jgi:beta-lactamase regulating signal transducer with metallopeptidase domain
MNRGTGTGLIGLGIVLVVIGAILDFAVTATTSGLNINTVGAILLIVGICCVVIGAIVFGVGSFRQTTVRENVRMSPDGGQDRVVQQRETF